jgi:hypothetical protein
VTDEDISSNLPDMLEEREVQVWVLEPGQLQVTLHKGAVCIPKSKNIDNLNFSINLLGT